MSLASANTVIGVGIVVMGALVTISGWRYLCCVPKEKSKSSKLFYFSRGLLFFALGVAITVFGLQLFVYIAGKDEHLITIIKDKYF